MNAGVDGGGATPVGSRRAARRTQTIEEILGLALEIMGEAGAGSLSYAELARRLGVRPPSLYKYFSSVMAIYDELFRRGQRAHRDAVAAAMHEAKPGMDSIRAGFDAAARWTADQPVLAQLLFWRPIPGFEPSPEAFAPSVEMVGLFRTALSQAVDTGELVPAGGSEEALSLLSVLAAGISSQYMANEPGRRWKESRYLPLGRAALDMFQAAYGASTSEP